MGVDITKNTKFIICVKWLVVTVLFEYKTLIYKVGVHSHNGIHVQIKIIVKQFNIYIF